MEELQNLIKFLKNKGLKDQKIPLDVWVGIIEYFASKQETKQCDIHIVVKSLPTSKEMTDVVSDISIQAKRSNDELDIASYGIGFIDGYRWTVENSEK